MVAIPKISNETIYGKSHSIILNSYTEGVTLPAGLVVYSLQKLLKGETGVFVFSWWNLTRQCVVIFKSPVFSSFEFTWFLWLPCHNLADLVCNNWNTSISFLEKIDRIKFLYQMFFSPFKSFLNQFKLLYSERNMQMFSDW